MDDGALEVVASGDNEKINTLIEFLRLGTPASKVEKIEIEEYKGKVGKEFKRL